MVRLFKIKKYVQFIILYFSKNNTIRIVNVENPKKIVQNVKNQKTNNVSVKMLLKIWEIYL